MMLSTRLVTSSPKITVPPAALKKALEKLKADFAGVYLLLLVIVSELLELVT